MKRVCLYMAALAIFVSSCDKVTELATIQKDLDFSETVDIPGLPNGIDTVFPGTQVTGDLPTFPIATNSKQFLESNGSSATSEKVEHVKLIKFINEVTAPADGNFDYLKDIKVYISAAGLSEVLAARKNDIPKGSKKIELDCESVNLKEYFLKDSMYIRMNATFVGIPPEGGKINIKPTFNIKANLLAAEE